MCNGSINKGIKGVYGSVTVVHLRHILVRRIWTAWIFLYSSLLDTKLILSQGEMKTPHSFIWLDQGGGKVGGAWVFA